jgi:simple sugar transport system permease protein
MEVLLVLFQVLSSTLRVSTPLLLAALGGMVSERSGVINIALEGMMLAGAFGGAGIALMTGSPWLGALGAMGAALLIAAFYAFFVIELRADQIVAGTAINLLAAGITPFLSKIFYGSSTSSPSLDMSLRFQSAPVWAAWILVLLGWFWMYYTPSGLWVRFAGEHPESLDSAGVRVKRVRWMAVLMSGCLAGLGGASLSIFLSSSFTRNMTAGRGFMALAALIFGKWKPVQTAAACLLFGFSDAIQTRLQGVILWGQDPVPVQFIQILPYVATILILAGVVGQSKAPRALGLPFDQG